MGRPKKDMVTWKMIFADFKKQFPKLHKQVLHYRPYDYATILLYLPEGRKALYNYDTKKYEFITIIHT